MKKCFLFITLLFVVLASSYGQDFQGKAIYESKTSMGEDFGPPDMPEDRKKRMKERMKSMFEKTYVLSFDQTSSTYLEEEKLEQPSNNNGRGGFRMMAFGGSGKYYKNIKEQTYVNQKEMLGKVFLIKDSLPSLKWEMGSETKQIGKYTCYKATALKKVDATSIENFRPPGRPQRNKEEAKKDSTKRGKTIFKKSEKPKEIEITAWYTLDIPINQGPAEYWGLPGLILEVNAGKTTILCSKIIMNAKEKEVIEPPKKGKEITQEKYDKVSAEKMKEMSERFQSGRGRGNSGGRPRN